MTNPHRSPGPRQVAVVVTVELEVEVEASVYPAEPPTRHCPGGPAIVDWGEVLHVDEGLEPLRPGMSLPRRHRLRPPTDAERQVVAAWLEEHAEEALELALEAYAEALEDEEDAWGEANEERRREREFQAFVEGPEE